jgi:hypothetical protein
MRRRLIIAGRAPAINPLATEARMAMTGGVDRLVVGVSTMTVAQSRLQL